MTGAEPDSAADAELIELSQGLSGYFSTEELHVASEVCGVEEFPIAIAATGKAPVSPEVRAAVRRSLMARGVLRNQEAADETLYGPGGLLLGPVCNASARISLDVILAGGIDRTVWHLLGPLAVQQQASSREEQVMQLTAVAAEEVLADLVLRAGLSGLPTVPTGDSSAVDVAGIRWALGSEAITSVTVDDELWGPTRWWAATAGNEAASNVGSPCVVADRQVRALVDVSLEGELGASQMTWLLDEIGGTWLCSSSSESGRAELVPGQVIFERLVGQIPRGPKSPTESHPDR